MEQPASTSTDCCADRRAGHFRSIDWIQPLVWNGRRCGNFFRIVRPRPENGAD